MKEVIQSICNKLDLDRASRFFNRSKSTISAWKVKDAADPQTQMIARAFLRALERGKIPSQLSDFDELQKAYTAILRLSDRGAAFLGAFLVELSEEEGDDSPSLKTVEAVVAATNKQTEREVA